MGTKTFYFGVSWEMYEKASMEVPIDFSIEDAMEYAQDNWHGVGLPSGEYVQDSDEPDFESCGFGEGE